MQDPRADRLIRALYTGLPINGKDGQELLSEASNQAISAAAAAVDRMRGRVANGEQIAFWITGQPGNGKTQSLKQLIHQLPSTPGAGKYALAAIDFDKEPDARTRYGLVPAVVRQCVFAGTVIGGVQQVRDAATKGQATDPTRVEAIAFGIDVVASLSSMPPVAFVASKGLQSFMRWVRRHRRHIHRQLEKRWPSNPQLVEFLSLWTRYLLEPTPEIEKDFSAHLTQLARQNQLFDIFAYALQQSGYTTLVLVFDEVTADAVASLKILRDPQLNVANALDQSLNLVYILAAREAVLNETKADPALSRRFCDPPNGSSSLVGPRIDTADSKDDFRHVAEKVQELINEANHLRKPWTPVELGALRQRLSAQANVTWQVLWREVIGLMARL